MGRKSKNFVGEQRVRLPQELYEIKQKYGYDEAFFRFLFRKYHRLCVHPFATTDLATGEQKCGVCGSDNFENYSKWANHKPAEWTESAGETVAK